MKYINKEPNELMYHILMDEISIIENDKFLIIKILDENEILSNKISYEVKNKKTRKTFSMGHSYDKRYYLEARKIK